MNNFNEIELSIIIVTYNNENEINIAIDSINNRLDKVSYEIIVVDNFSKDKTRDIIKNNYNDIILIQLKENLGFAKANNIGLKLAKGNFILFMNPDVKIISDFIFYDMINFLKNNPEYMLVGTKIYNEDGSIQKTCARRFRTLPRHIFNFLHLDKISTKIKFIGKYIPSVNIYGFYYDRDIDVDVISGAFMMMNRKFYDNFGGFKELLFMGFDDDEICLRAHRKGFKIRFLHSLEIIHYSMRSTIPIQRTTLQKFTGPEAIFLFIREFQGKFLAVFYLFLIFLIIHFKLLFIPIFFVISFIFKKESKKIKNEIYSIYVNFLWVYFKFYSFFLKGEVNLKIKVD